MGKENYYHTGIFTNVSKSTLLMSIVDNVLQRRFNVTTLCGPRTSLNTCEIILRSRLNIGIPDFHAAKDVLERYLDVTHDKLLLTSKKYRIARSPKRVKVTSSKSVHMASPRISSSCEPNVLDATVIDLDNTDAGCQSVDVIDLDETVNEKADTRDAVENNENISWWNKYKSCVTMGQRTSKRIHKSTENKPEKCVDVLREASGQKVAQRKSNEDDSVILCSDDEVMVIEDSMVNDVVILDSEDDRSVNATCKQDSVDTCKRTLPLVSMKNRNKTVTASKRDIDRSIWPLEKHKKKREKKKLLKQLRKEFKQNIKRHKESVNANCSGKPCSQNESVRGEKNKSKSNWQRPAHLDALLTRSHATSHTVEQVEQNLKTISNTSKSSCGVGSNVYNPNSSEKINIGPRPIIIDGSNVAISHGKGDFSFRGLQICVDYFIKRGHRVIKVFVPQFRRNLAMHREPKVLANLEKNDFLILTPSRRVDGKMVVSYDDRYIVQTAAELGGVIVSTDNYRDLLSENPAWKETIEKRLLMFTWVDDILMFPQDPLGRFGPSLDEFLMFPTETKQ